MCVVGAAVRCLLPRCRVRRPVEGVWKAEYPIFQGHRIRVCSQRRNPAAFLIFIQGHCIRACSQRRTFATIRNIQRHRIRACAQRRTIATVLFIPRRVIAGEGPVPCHHDL